MVLIIDTVELNIVLKAAAQYLRNFQIEYFNHKSFKRSSSYESKFYSSDCYVPCEQICVKSDILPE